MLDHIGNHVVDIDDDFEFIQLDAADACASNSQGTPRCDDRAANSEASHWRQTTRHGNMLPPQTSSEIRLYGKSDDPRDRAAIDHFEY
jgi:hypothetical protein